MRYAALALGLLSLACLAPSPTEAGCGESDLDDDGVVGIFDLAIFAAALPPNPYDPCVDFNSDGKINVIDLGLWASGL